LQIRGEFQDGKKEGTWDFWDSSGTQTVKLSYHDGMKNGPCTMWYSALSGDPRRGGRLKLDMAFVNDQVDGVKMSYYSDPGIGSLRSEDVFDHGRIVKARHWTPERKELSAEEAMMHAEKDLEADQRYFDSMDKLVADNATCPREHN